MEPLYSYLKFEVFVIFILHNMYDARLSICRVYLLITDCHIPLHVDMSIRNEVVRTKVSVGYLGIRPYLRLTFSYRIQYLAKKSHKIVEQLSRWMTNIGSPLLARRRLQMEISNNIMLYGNARGYKAYKLTCSSTENGCIANNVDIAYSVRPSSTCDSRYNPLGSTGGRADGDL